MYLHVRSYTRIQFFYREMLIKLRLKLTNGIYLLFIDVRHITYNNIEFQIVCKFLIWYFKLNNFKVKCCFSYFVKENNKCEF